MNAGWWWRHCAASSLTPTPRHFVTDVIVYFSLFFFPLVTQLKSTLCSDGILQSVQNSAESWQEQSSVMWKQKGTQAFPDSTHRTSYPYPKHQPAPKGNLLWVQTEHSVFSCSTQLWNHNMEWNSVLMTRAYIMLEPFSGSRFGCHYNAEIKAERSN